MHPLAQKHDLPIVNLDARHALAAQTAGARMAKHLGMAVEQLRFRKT